jgi:hypothetical protein
LHELIQRRKFRRPQFTAQREVGGQPLNSWRNSNFTFINGLTGRPVGKNF